MAENLLIVHGGGPTAVINSSLYGVLRYAKHHPVVHRIFAAKNGTGGILRENFLDLTSVSNEEAMCLKKTPGSAIGTSRDPLEEADYARIVEILEKHHIKYVMFNGGNGTMDACGKLYRICTQLGKDICVMGIPKTMDNDLAVTDHSPGFASAAKYIATSVRELCYDVESMPIHVVVVEVSGRNVGWLTAASAMADKSGRYAPDLIYVPEIPFSEEKFLKDVKEKLQEKSGIVVVVSEGLRDANQKPIVKPIFQIGRSTYFGDISSHLANLVIRKLGYKARGEKPGLFGRVSIAMQSAVDVNEAILVGEEATKAVLSKESGKMIGLKREDGQGYAVTPIAIDIREVMMLEKKLPHDFINETKNGVAKNFIKWCEPLVGEIGNAMIRFE